ncbi:MAG: NAD(P)/FAD-dependent oxidoreductase [Anaerolineae bacterium]|nr:NAD(P)/FAD-dependent oxidoreductase [Anaerolineae bacterium]
MKAQYDVIIAGAGPAGSAAAIRAAEAGLSVLLLEKRQEIGVPVRCGEATDVKTPLRFMPFDPRWLHNRIDHFAVYNAQGERVVVPPSSETIIVDRRVFDQALANQASALGADVYASSTVIGLLHDEHGTVCGVRLKQFGTERAVRARLVIAADGTESQVARWAGLKTIPPLADYYTGIQFLLGNLRGRIDPRICEYHIGVESLAPGGYLWVFPKSGDTANVGVVIAADRARPISARAWLERFVARRCPGASILSVMAGGIPITGALKRMTTDGLMAVGDAAHQADPLTAGGIGLGMIGAEMAMQVAAPALQAGDVSARRLQAYERLWRDQFGRMHAALYNMRRILTRMTETHFDALVRTAAAMPLETMSLPDIVVGLLKNHPGLLLEARTLVSTGLLLK